MFVGSYEFFSAACFIFTQGPDICTLALRSLNLEALVQQNFNSRALKFSKSSFTLKKTFKPTLLIFLNPAGVGV